MKRNVVQITLTLTQIGVSRFRVVPAFKNLLHPNQIAGLIEGDNFLSVNHTVLGSLKRMAGSDSNNIKVYAPCTP